MSGFVLLAQRIESISFYLIPFLQSAYQEAVLYCVNEHLFVSLLLLGIILPFSQEILFRGIILNGFKENYSQKKSILFSAILYTIIYFILNSPILSIFVIRFFIGSISAWMCLKTKSILPGIFINLFYNMTNFLLIKFNDIAPITELFTAYIEQPFKLLWFDVIGMVLVIAGIFLLVNSIKKYSRYLTPPDNFSACQNSV